MIDNLRNITNATYRPKDRFGEKVLALMDAFNIPVSGDTVQREEFVTEISNRHLIR